eukprot:CAMPEP_0174705742 /NCGR_PEP_ID=MMETSP1094-20130205/8855_1 /TAXON_ID=156173 /ORGANISM="Chrysochromulina brevifilum, Strain UTEX LB 985" /LENGTH=44 /DNA_ID= /DNA_START= /DNA_END= /DNA_ORIENTATION=
MRQQQRARSRVRARIIKSRKELAAVAPIDRQSARALGGNARAAG